MGLWVGFLQRYDTFLSKRKALGEHAASPHPDRTLHGKCNICFIGKPVKQLDHVPIGAGNPQGEETIFLGGNGLGKIVPAGKDLDAFKMQGVVDPLNGNTFFVGVEDPDLS